MGPASKTSPFQAPALGAHYLRRPRLANRLSQGLEGPVSFVEAGAGYGKTSLLVDFAGAAGRKVAWFRLGRRDRQMAFFLGRLTRAVRLAFPGWPFADHQNRGPGMTSFSLFSEATSCLPEPLVLVLDDFHVLEGLKWVGEGMELLVADPRPKVHLAVLSRHAAPAYIAGRGARLAKGDLTFTPEETRQLMALVAGAVPAPEVVDRIMEETRGWPHGILAIARGLDSRQGTRRAILQYLEREVFARAPGMARELLVKTSFLPAVDPGLADALLGRKDSAALLEEMVRTHSFVDAEGTPPQYRCHPLFKRFLAARLAENGVDAKELLRKGAELLAGAGEVETAFRVYAGMGDWTRGGKLLAQRAYGTIRSGRGPVVAQLMEILPVQQVASDPKLLLLKSKLAEIRGNYEEATAWAQQALAAAQECEDQVGTGHALATLGVLRRLQADFAGARALLEQGLALVPQKEAAWYRLNLAAAYLASCQYSSVESICRPMADDPAAYEDETAEGEALHILGMTYFFYAGRPGLGLDMLLRAAAAKEKAGLRQSASLTIAVLGLCYLVQGDFQQALGLAERALGMARSSVYLRVQALAQGVAGWALVELDRPAVAEGLLREAAATLSEKADHWLYTTVLPGLALQREVGGDYPGAFEAHRQGLAAARAMGTCFHIAWCLLFQAGFHHRSGESQRAEALLGEAEALVKDCPGILAEASSYLRRALVYRGRGDSPRAQDPLLRALELAGQHGYRFFVGARPWEVSSLLSWAAAGTGELAYKAREFLAPGKAEPGPLAIRGLGTFEVRRGPELVTPARWRRPGVKRLFKYLVVNRGRWIGRERIIEDLWPHLPAPAAANNLRYALSTLRGVLEPGAPRDSRLVLAEKGLLKLILPHACFLDLADLEESAARARSAEREEEAVACWEEVIRLYRGDLLEDELYQDWAALPREVLRETYLEALFHLASHYQGAGYYDRAIGIWQKVLAKDPLREEAHRGLMKCYARAGQRGAALHQYAFMKDLLRQELDAEPDPETLALHRRLMAGEAS